MDTLINIANYFDLKIFIPMVIVMWYFTREVKNGIRNDMNALDKKIEVAHRRMDDIYKVIVDIVKK